jgi:ATP-dependent Clp protease ATP-binding subunit ClpC
MVEDPLSEQMLAGEWKPGDVVMVDVADDEIVFTKGDQPVEVPAPSSGASRSRASMPARGGRERRGSGAADGSASA